MQHEPTPRPFYAPALQLWPPATIVLRQTTTLDGPSSEVFTYVERFDGLDLTHVLTHVPYPCDLENGMLYVIETIEPLWEEALREISPF